VPQLCLLLDGQPEVVDRMTLVGMGQLNLQGPIQGVSMSINDTSKTFTIDLHGQQVQFAFKSAQQMALDNLTTASLTEEDLVRWLDREVRQPDVGQVQMQAWLLRMVGHLQSDQGYTLAQLVRSRFVLVPVLTRELDRLRNQAVKQGFQQQLPGMTVADPHKEPHCAFRFVDGAYPATNVYRGSYRFSKHYFGSHMVHYLPERTTTGKLKEEFLCAQAIDTCPQVKHWVRNIPKQEKSSFWLPTSTDYFYPDFVAELTDGRLLVIEYNGADRWSDDDSKEKRLIGRKWQDESQGRCLFLMARERDDFGRDVAGQIAEILK
jgi:type III restriction enzyme